MTNETMPADWAINRVFKDVGESDDAEWLKTIDPPAPYIKAIIKLARYIEAHEEPPVDRKLLCAREAAARDWDAMDQQGWASQARAGFIDFKSEIASNLRAITLYEEGFGNDQH